jgi:hypothetical protein
MGVLVREVFSALGQATGEDFAAGYASFTREKAVFAFSLALRGLVLVAALGKADVGECAEDGGRLGEVRGGEEGGRGDAGKGGGPVGRQGGEGGEGEARRVCEEAEEGLGDAGHAGSLGREEDGVTGRDGDPGGVRQVPFKRRLDAGPAYRSGSHVLPASHRVLVCPAHPRCLLRLLPRKIPLLRPLLLHHSLRRSDAPLRKRRHESGMQPPLSAPPI